ncbi:MAG: flagellar basal body rod C-terminal domain-containing protein [Desulfonauticus sp.]|nr:flagellar basal body rod C-terminal domain-containing protein [Desulfonauticus sp.]
MEVFSISTSALKSSSLAEEVSANNIANINTPEFKASRVDLETGQDGKGVVVSQISQDQNPGAISEQIELQPNAQTGQIEQQIVSKETSNTDLAQEMVNQILNERFFEANTRPISTYDSMLGNFINIFA